MRRDKTPEQIAARNAKILRLRDVDCVPVAWIARRFGMTAGQVSQICMRTRKARRAQAETA